MSTKRENSIDATSAKEEKLKKQYGAVTKLTFKLRDKELIAYLKEPDLITLDATMSTINGAPLSSAIGMFKSCFVDGDKELLTECESNAGLAIAISKQIQLIIPNVLVSSIIL
jgi:hypothetical protein